MSDAPDCIEPVVGWRVWVVGEEANRFRLRSIVYDIFWPPRCELAAECLRSRPLLPKRWRRSHEPPHARCRCGIYATSERERVAEYLCGSYGSEPGEVQRVFGRVLLWGTVVACERGWRASRAYPARLYVPAWNPDRVNPVEQVALDLGDYGVPVEIVGSDTQYELAPTFAAAHDTHPRARAESGKARCSRASTAPACRVPFVSVFDYRSERPCGPAV